jgi:hypothetical protein
VHLAGFTVEIYCDPRSYERQKSEAVTLLPYTSFTALAFVGHSGTSQRNSPAAYAFTEITQLYRLFCMRVSHEFSMLHSRLSTSHSHKNTNIKPGDVGERRGTLSGLMRRHLYADVLTTEGRVENVDTTSGLPEFHSSLRKTSKK